MEIKCVVCGDKGFILSKTPIVVQGVNTLYMRFTPCPACDKKVTLAEAADDIDAAITEALEEGE